MSFENTVGIGVIARNEQFLLFPQCFLPVWRTLWPFQVQNCHLQTLSDWKSLKFVVWERDKQGPQTYLWRGHNHVHSKRRFCLCWLGVIRRCWEDTEDIWWKIEFYFIEWTPSVIFSQVAQPRVKILPMVFTKWNKFLSLTETPPPPPNILFISCF